MTTIKVARVQRNPEGGSSIKHDADIFIKYLSVKIIIFSFYHRRIFLKGTNLHSGVGLLRAPFSIKCQRAYPALISLGM